MDRTELKNILAVKKRQYFLKGDRKAEEAINKALQHIQAIISLREKIIDFQAAATTGMTEGMESDWVKGYLTALQDIENLLTILD